MKAASIYLSYQWFRRPRVEQQKTALLKQNIARNLHVTVKVDRSNKILVVFHLAQTFADLSRYAALISFTVLVHQAFHPSGVVYLLFAAEIPGFDPPTHRIASLADR